MRIIRNFISFCIEEPTFVVFLLFIFLLVGLIYWAIATENVAFFIGMAMGLKK